ncbi:MAG: 23S rRNA methyltransferase [Coriobacteriia bacterium]|nr:23S rRNA methyltransferase [Coriobacteriia bacterium]
MVDFCELLECPVCQAHLDRDGGSLRCAGGHCFDIARQGYVNLLSGGAGAGTADSREMVRAREAFFATGHYHPLIDAVAADTSAAAAGVPGCIIDAGAGTGEYLAATLEATPGRIGLALDISKHAARVAARIHPQVSAVVCDVWGRLPVRCGVAAAVMSVFAPRNAAEAARVLAPGGALVVVAPNSRHLNELIEPLGMISVDPLKSERIARTLGERFILEHSRGLEERVTLTVDDAVTLVSMGPSARHTTPDRVRERAVELGASLEATIAVDISVWRLCARSEG